MHIAVHHIIDPIGKNMQIVVRQASEREGNTKLGHKYFVFLNGKVTVPSQNQSVNFPNDLNPFQQTRQTQNCRAAK
jgi:hypothetical protein